MFAPSCFVMSDFATHDSSNRGWQVTAGNKGLKNTREPELGPVTG
jgi:hypothetical protein